MQLTVLRLKDALVISMEIMKFEAHQTKIHVNTKKEIRVLYKVCVQQRKTNPTACVW